ncbi:hypothetical protein HD806DRAFT_531705 [Xylariaceae sp. AK1471]|nr:hypothetical protein HD806DRAFT_531705 [Xylariaceae sp. AK1471]
MQFSVTLLVAMLVLAPNALAAPVSDSRGVRGHARNEFATPSHDTREEYATRRIARDDKFRTGRENLKAVRTSKARQDKIASQAQNQAKADALKRRDQPLLDPSLSDPSLLDFLKKHPGNAPRDVEEVSDAGQNLTAQADTESDDEPYINFPDGEIEKNSGYSETFILRDLCDMDDDNYCETLSYNTAPITIARTINYYEHPDTTKDSDSEHELTQGHDYGDNAALDAYTKFHSAPKSNSHQASRYA